MKKNQYSFHAVAYKLGTKKTECCTTRHSTLHTQSQCIMVFVWPSVYATKGDIWSANGAEENNAQSGKYQVKWIKRGYINIEAFGFDIMKTHARVNMSVQGSFRKEYKQKEWF